ncbi:MAG: 23S rRNA (adenine(2503)-C(2))-methyltransferase RlmN [Bacillota bacterium]|nr:MAG: 23S rRNA (adenine(2503)-C(2))-methyltransferase RlmN [Bacillota bacterium]
MKDVLLDCSEEELKGIFAQLGQPAYRASQVFSALHNNLSFEEMSNLPKALRAELSERYFASPAKIIETLESADGTKKYLFALQDGNVVEGVLMRYKYGNTQCVSTQVGCRMNCAFCASGLHGLVRNLTAGEILGQITAVNAAEGGNIQTRKVTNVVLMGSGEPLDNYDNVIRFLNNLSAKGGLNVSLRNVSLSTCGLVDRMERFAEEKLPVNLTISLHSPFDEERKKIMPVAKKYGIKEILKACERYFSLTGRRFIFEYVLIAGENDTKRHADALVALLKGKPCHVNLIRLNEVKERDLRAATDKSAYSFLGLLEKGGLSATLRRRMGADIDGACGQLRQKYIENGESL